MPSTVQETQRSWVRPDQAKSSTKSKPDTSRAHWLVMTPRGSWWEQTGKKKKNTIWTYSSWFFWLKWMLEPLVVFLYIYCKTVHLDLFGLQSSNKLTKFASAGSQQSGSGSNSPGDWTQNSRLSGTMPTTPRNIWSGRYHSLRIFKL